jgi:transposase
MVMLPRSCGHLIVWDDGSREEFTSADVTTAVSARVPAADGGAGAGWPHPRRTRGEFEPTAQSIPEFGWSRPTAMTRRRADGLTSAKKDELARLRREVRQLREEREILKRAAVSFARETDRPK